MHIHIIAVGRARAGPERALYQHYAARLAWPVTLKEIDLRPPKPPEQQRAREAEAIRAAMPDGARIIALDERGGTLASAELAARIAAWRDQGAAALACLIGGADGLDPALVAGADLALALGRLTWPHLLVRGLVAEQLYRVQQILAGHPYHRG